MQPGGLRESISTSISNQILRRWCNSPGEDRWSSHRRREPRDLLPGRSRCLAWHQGFSPGGKAGVHRWWGGQNIIALIARPSWGVGRLIIWYCIFHLFQFYTHSKSILWGGDGVELPIVVETSDRTHLKKHLSLYWPIWSWCYKSNRLLVLHSISCKFGNELEHLQ